MISIEGLSVHNGSFSLEEITLTVPSGEYAVLMGKTGCGKTTVLEAICGLKRPHAGVIRLMGRDVTNLKAAERGIGYVPQDVALFRTMTIRRHLAFALRVRRWPRRDIDARVGELADMLGLTDLLERRPIGLSGGEARRVALGRALAFYPTILCLDEPLSSLDYETREEMCRLLKMLQERTGVTTLHVTHDHSQVLSLADRLFQFSDGQVHEVQDLQAFGREGEAKGPRAAPHGPAGAATEEKREDDHA